MYFLSLGPGGWTYLAGGPSLFFWGGSSDSRLVSIVRDFLGKFLRGGLLIIVPLIALYSTAVFFGTLIASLFPILDVDLKVFGDS